MQVGESTPGRGRRQIRPSAAALSVEPCAPAAHDPAVYTALVAHRKKRDVWPSEFLALAGACRGDIPRPGQRSARTSRKASASSRTSAARRGLSREYRFDYGKSRANRFARRVPRDAVVIVLDSDVAKVIRDPKRINAILRATITAGPKRRRRRTG